MPYYDPAAPRVRENPDTGELDNKIGLLPNVAYKTQLAALDQGSPDGAGSYTERPMQRSVTRDSCEQEHQTVRRPSSSGPHSVSHDKSANLANASKGRGGACSLFDTALS